MSEFSADNFIDWEHFPANDIISIQEPIWNLLKKTSIWLEEHLTTPKLLGNVEHGAKIGTRVYIGEGTNVEHGAVIQNNVFIGKHCQIRSGAYIRNNSIIGDNCVIGNSSEIKNSIISDESEIPHFNYVGDSILGYRTHLGAGVILSNLRLDREIIKINYHGKTISTNLKKFGAIVSSHAEIGCNSVVNPGSILGKGSLIYPNVNWSGILPANHIAKLKQSLTIIKRKT